MKRPSSGLLFYSVGILVVGFRDAFPLAVEFEQKQEVGEVDSPSPPLFKNSHNGYRLLYGKDINAGIEVVAGSDSIDVVIELFD